MAKTALHSSMGRIVIDMLAQLHPLPDVGFVAGGAVNAAIRRHLGLGIDPINDIDIFFVPRGRRRIAMEERLQHSRLGTCNFTIRVTDRDYLGRKFIRGEFTHRILNSQRDGILNWIAVEPSRSIPLSPDLMLRTFDINCCQVGVCLKTGLLHWTKSYQRFIETRELHLTAANTPYHSAIRYFKKKEELDCVYGNDSLNMEILMAATSVQAKGSSGLMFGSKMAKKYIELIDQIGPFFEMIKRDQFYSLEGRGEISKIDSQRFSQYFDYDLNCADAFLFARKPANSTMMALARFHADFPENSENITEEDHALIAYVKSMPEGMFRGFDSNVARRMIRIFGEYSLEELLYRVPYLCAVSRMKNLQLAIKDHGDAMVKYMLSLSIIQTEIFDDPQSLIMHFAGLRAQIVKDDEEFERRNSKLIRVGFFGRLLRSYLKACSGLEVQQLHKMSAVVKEASLMRNCLEATARSMQIGGLYVARWRGCRANVYAVDGQIVEAKGFANGPLGIWFRLRIVLFFAVESKQPTRQLFKEMKAVTDRLRSRMSAIFKADIF